jgi:hypothetical protein
VSVARSVLLITSDEDRLYFGDGKGSNSHDQVGVLNGAVSRFGRGYIDEPDVIAKELAADAAVAATDTLLLTIPNQLGVDSNARLLRTIVDHVVGARLNGKVHDAGVRRLTDTRTAPLSEIRWTTRVKTQGRRPSRSGAGGEDP